MANEGQRKTQNDQLSRHSGLNDQRKNVFEVAELAQVMLVTVMFQTR